MITTPPVIHRLAEQRQQALRVEAEQRQRASFPMSSISEARPQSPWAGGHRSFPRMVGWGRLLQRWTQVMLGARA